MILSQFFIFVTQLLYDPINPDVSAQAVQTCRKQDLLDREFWFFQKFSSCLVSAGFQELDAEHLKKCFVMKPVGQGVLANMEPEGFDVFRCWILGDSNNGSALPLKPTLKNWFIFLGEEASNKILNRVVVAHRAKGKGKLYLKLFRDIPSGQLHLLFPPYGGLKMHESYFNLLFVTTGLSAFFLLSKYVVAWLVGNSYHLDYLPIGFSAFFGMVSVLLWTNFKQRQKRYLCDVLEVFSNRCIASNQNLLAVISDKVQEEMLKGILLTFLFMAASQKELESVKGQAGIQVNDLKKSLNHWIESQTKQQFDYDVIDSLAWLSAMGLIEIDNSGEICPLSLSHALKILPAGHDFTLPIRAEEFNLIYGSLPQDTILKKQDFLDKLSFAVWTQLDKLKSKS